MLNVNYAQWSKSYSSFSISRQKVHRKTTKRFYKIIERGGIDVSICYDTYNATTQSRN